MVGEILRRLSQFILNFSVGRPTPSGTSRVGNFQFYWRRLSLAPFALPILLAIFEVSEIFGAAAVPHIGQPDGRCRPNDWERMQRLSGGRGGGRGGRGGRFYIIKGTLPDWKRGIKPNQPWS